MTRATIVSGLIAGGAIVAGLVLGLLVLAGGDRALEWTFERVLDRRPDRRLEQDVDPVVSTPPASVSSTSSASSNGPAASERHQDFLYGRITTLGGTSYEGRLRWGGDEEAFWGDYFNGFKSENPWAGYVPPERLKERHALEIFGFELAQRERQVDLSRPFMARFGDIARIEAKGRELRVTLKSGTVFHLDRYAADDLADGVRVWDATSGIVDLGERRIRTIEFLPTPLLSDGPERLHGTVRTRHGDFTGFVQWHREKCIGSDELHGHTADGELSLRFDAIRSIACSSRNGSLVTLLDGREVVLSGTPEVGEGNRGTYLDDKRYGRVLVSWEAFEQVDFDFSPGGSGPGGPSYGDFPPGRTLTGSVTTRGGHRLVGQLVYDLDESETTETLDAPLEGVDYTIPFGLIASIVPAGREERGVQHAKVILHRGEEILLERAGDLGEGNAGMLIFVEGRERPEYVAWVDIERIELDRPATMYP